MARDASKFPPEIAGAAHKAWAAWELAHPSLAAVMDKTEVINRLCERLHKSEEAARIADSARVDVEGLAGKELHELLGL